MASFEATEEKKWEGTARSKIIGVSSDRAWPFLADFFNWETIAIAIESSIELEGISGKPGCIRKLTLKPEASLGWEDKYSRWGVEKLVEIDHNRKWMRYVVLDNTFGWDKYEATITILPLQGSTEDSELIWSFSLDHVKDGRSLDTMIVAYKATLESVATRLEQLCELPNNIILASVSFLCGFVLSIKLL